MKRKRRLWIGAGMLIVILAAVLFAATRGLTDAANVTLSGISGALLTAEDGDYQGSYENGRFSNTVRVTVKDHRIAQIDVVKDMMVPLFTQETFQKVIAAQETSVDAVSGPTVSGKAYLKAIENALLSLPPE